MKTFLFTLITITVALATVGLSEVVNMLWLDNVPFDATGNFFWATLLPVQVIVVGITTALLMRVYAYRPTLLMPLYAVAYLVAHTMELNAFFNPLPDILSYAGAITISLSIWFSILWRYYLKPRTQSNA